jgi:hypothetical protein
MADSCAVCYQDFDEDAVKQVTMPCCGRSDSTVQYCGRCIEIIAETGLNENIGKCPTCSKYFRINSVTKSISTLDALRTVCRMCNQVREITDARLILCAGCTLGRQFTFSYECDHCHRVQHIPHPMWLYQPTAGQYGTVPWACHQGCGDYTYWRITEEQALQIPPEHCPETWGRREEWLANIREIRRREGDFLHPVVDRNGDQNNAHRQAFLNNLVLLGAIIAAIVYAYYHQPSM